MHDFNETERAILRRVQVDLPDGPEPYAAIAEETGATEEQVLELLRRLKDEGAIRRFGATLRHQKAGYGANAMVAWRIPEDIVDQKGLLAAEHPRVSHCYHRATHPQWDFTLYTMVHGQSPEDAQNAVEELCELLGTRDYDILASLKELKKTSMIYF